MKYAFIMAIFILVAMEVFGMTLCYFIYPDDINSLWSFIRTCA